MKRAVFVILLGGLALAAGEAMAEIAATADTGKDMILNIVREVLGIVVEFIGNILDEFVRAIKEIMNSSDKKS
jgi:hypothetical protein